MASASWCLMKSLKLQRESFESILTSLLSRPLLTKTVFYQCPWNFNGYYMVLKEWPPDLNLQDIDLTHSAFWIHIYGLPLELMTTENAEKIG